MLPSRMILILCLSCCSLHAGWHDRKAEGWAWYEDKEKKEPPKEEKTPKEMMSEFQEKLEQSRYAALLNPTKENVEHYMRLQKIWIEQSRKFSSSWQKVLLEHPDLDPIATGFPISHYGRQIQKRVDDQKRKEMIEKVSKEHGLFFFFDGTIASDAFAKVVVKLSQRYQWEIVAVSTDGNFLKEFPNALSNNGISEKFGVSTFPSLFILNPKTDEVYPIGYGMLSLDELEKNILLQFEFMKKEE